MPLSFSSSDSMHLYEGRMSDAENHIGATKKKMSDMHFGELALLGQQVASGLTVGE